MLSFLLILVSLFAGLAIFVGFAIRKHAQEVLANSSNSVASEQPETKLEASTSLA